MTRRRTLKVQQFATLGYENSIDLGFGGQRMGEALNRGNENITWGSLNLMPRLMSICYQELQDKHIVMEMPLLISIGDKCARCYSLLCRKGEFRRAILIHTRLQCDCERAYWTCKVNMISHVVTNALQISPYLIPIICNEEFSFCLY